MPVPAGSGSVDGANGNYQLMLIMGFVTGAMTAAYMTRCYWLTFMGEWRGPTRPTPTTTPMPVTDDATHGLAHGAHDAPRCS